MTFTVNRRAAGETPPLEILGRRDPPASKTSLPACPISAQANPAGTRPRDRGPANFFEKRPVTNRPRIGMLFSRSLNDIDNRVFTELP